MKKIVFYFSAFFVGFVFYNFYLSNLPSLLDYDIFFHLQVAEEYYRNGSFLSPTRIPWIYDSIWKEHYYDTHFLYHIVLIPIWSLGVSIPVWISIFSAFCLVGYLLFVQPENSKELILFGMIFLIGSFVFTGRLMFGKGLVVFLPILFLFFLAWKKKNHFFIFATSSLAVWAYPLAPIILLFLGIEMILSTIRRISIKKNISWFHLKTKSYRSSQIIETEKQTSDKFLEKENMTIRGDLKSTNEESKVIKFGYPPILVAFLGFLSAIIIHPSYPHQFFGYWLEWGGQIFPPQGLEKIAEWNPPGWKLFLMGFLPLMILAFLSILTFIRNQKKSKTNCNFLDCGKKLFIGTDKWEESNLTLSLGILMMMGILASWFATKSLEWGIPIVFLWIGWNRTLITDFVFRSRYGFIVGLIFLSNLFLFAESSKSHSFSNLNKDSRKIALVLCTLIPSGSKVWILWDDFPEFSRECPRMVYPFGMNPLYSFSKDKNRYTMIQKYWEDQSPQLMEMPKYLGYNTIVLNAKRDNPSLIVAYSMSDNWDSIHTDKENFIFRYNKEKIPTSHK